MYALLEASPTTATPAGRCSPTSRSPGTCSASVTLRLDGLRSLAAPPRPRCRPDVVVGASGVLDDAATVASAFVNHVGSRTATRPRELYANDAVSRYGGDDPRPAPVRRAQRRARPRAARPASEASSSRSPTRPGASGTIAEGALFDESALDLVTDLAVDTTDGVATMRAGLDLHQQTQAASAPGGSPTARSPTSTGSCVRRSPTPPGSRPTSSATPGTGPRPTGGGGTT